MKASPIPGQLGNGIVGTYVRARQSFGGLLPRAHWIYLRTLVLPLVLMDLVFESLRVVQHGAVTGLLSFVDQMRSDLLFYVALVLFWVAVFAFVRSIWLRILLTAVLHLTFGVLYFFTIAGSAYFFVTGSLMGLDTVVEALSQFTVVRGAIESESTALMWIPVLVILVLCFVGPAVNIRKEHPRWMWTLPDSSRRSTKQSLKGGAALGFAVVVLLVLSALPNASGTTAFTRNRVVSIAMGSLAGGTARLPGFVQPTRSDIPVQTHLEATSATKKRNVVMIFMESAGAQSTSLYSPGIGTTPFLESLGQSSLVAQNAYAVVPHTSRSLLSGNCGVEPPLGIDNRENTSSVYAAKCLASLLGEQGYRSVFFQSATAYFERRPQLVKTMGYDEFRPVESLPKAGFSPAGYLGFEDDIMLEPSRAWAGKHRDKPFLMTYMTVTGHHDYQVPKGFATRHLSDDSGRNRYLNTVRYEDRFVEKVIDQFKAMGLYGNTIFVIMGDHGEGFGEHSLHQHDDTIYNEGIRIPLLFHDPDRFTSGKTVTTPVQNMTVLPTVADLLGFSITGGSYHSEALTAPSNGQVLRVSCFHRSRCLAEIDGTMKYIHHFGLRPDEYFDLASDPGEKDNIIADQDPKEMVRIRDNLLLWQAEVPATYLLAEALAQ